MSTPQVREAIQALAKVLAEQPHKARAKNPAATVIAMRAAQLGLTLDALKVSVSSESDVRGLLGTDEKVPAGLDGMRLHVQIGAAGASPEQLREIVSWADSHSPVGCTARGAQSTALEVEVL